MAQNEIILNKLLHQIAKEQNYINYDIKIEPVSSGGANYTTALYNITMTEGGNNIYLFGKVAIIKEKMRAGAPRVYEIENYAYTKIVTTYERLQDEHQIAQEHRLAFSKFYAYNPTEYEETLVLENLVKQGYQNYDRLKSVDWQYTKSALRDLAKMHALAFAFSEYYPEEFTKAVDDLKSYWIMEDEQIKSYYDGSMTKAVEVTKEKNKDKLLRFFDEIKEGLFENLYCKWGRRPVLGHGDYRLSNLLHRIRDVSLA